MGFKRCWHDLHAICVGFKVVHFKTHANTSKSSNQILKTHSKSNNRSIHKSTHSTRRKDLNAICIGFISIANCDVLFAWVLWALQIVMLLFAWVLRWYPLKTHANTSKSAKQILKTHSKSNNISVPSHRILIKSCWNPYACAQKIDAKSRGHAHAHGS